MPEDLWDLILWVPKWEKANAAENFRKLEEIMTKINPVAVEVALAISIYSLLSYIGFSIVSPPWLWVYFTVVTMGLSVFMGYFAHWYKEVTKDD